MTVRPRTGVRFVLDLAETTESEFIYRGNAHLPDEDRPAEVRVARAGGQSTAQVEGGDDLAAELAKGAASLVRAGTRGALAAGSSLPRRITRWRG